MNMQSGGLADDVLEQLEEVAIGAGPRIEDMLLSGQTHTLHWLQED